MTEIQNKLIQNALRTPDGTVLISAYRHDYQQYTDSVDGKTYMVDGGLDYIRGIVGSEGESLSLYELDPLEIVREKLLYYKVIDLEQHEEKPIENITWEYVFLKDIEDKHLKGVVKMKVRYTPDDPQLTFFEQELKYRKLC